LAPNLPSEALSTELEPSALSAFLAEPASEGETKHHEGWNFSYTFIELGFAEYDVDAIDDKADVYFGRASVGLLGFLHVFGEYTNQSFDIGNTDTDLIQLGVGAHFGVIPNLSLYGEIGWLFNDISSDLGDNDDTGYGLEGGARWMALPWSGGGLEVNGSLGYYDLEGVSNEDRPFYWTVGARVHFIEVLSIGAEYMDIEDDDQISFSARFSF
jgi:hypothetical protein